MIRGEVAEANRQQLREVDYKVKFDVPEEFHDGVADQMMKLIRDEQRTLLAERGHKEEPHVVIPRPKCKATKREQ